MAKTDNIETLRKRFESHPDRHPNLKWSEIEPLLGEKVLKVFEAMETTGGEPDVVEFEADSAGIFLVDCAKQSPKERRSLCYDRAALDSRKEHKPRGDALSMAEEMGIELLTEDQYRQLQAKGEFDLTTSSWVLSPDDFRKQGGALFGDRRFGRTFIYCNGAESYYASRGFRGAYKLK